MGIRGADALIIVLQGCLGGVFFVLSSIATYDVFWWLHPPVVKWREAIMTAFIAVTFFTFGLLTMPL